jgi:hypothetical protein
MGTRSTGDRCDIGPAVSSLARAGIADPVVELRS